MRRERLCETPTFFESKELPKDWWHLALEKKIFLEKPEALYHLFSKLLLIYINKELEFIATVHTCQLYVVYSQERAYAWEEQEGKADLCRTNDGELENHPSSLWGVLVALGWMPLSGWDYHCSSILEPVWKRWRCNLVNSKNFACFKYTSSVLGHNLRQIFFQKPIQWIPWGLLDLWTYFIHAVPAAVRTLGSWSASKGIRTAVNTRWENLSDCLNEDITATELPALVYVLLLSTWSM